jgi:hypothetical protein
MTGQVGIKSIKPQTITQQEQNGPHSLSRRTSASWVLPLLTAISPTASPHPTNLASRDKLQHGSPLWMAKVKINISCTLFATRYAQGASGETVRYLKPGVFAIRPNSRALVSASVRLQAVGISLWGCCAGLEWLGGVGGCEWWVRGGIWDLGLNEEERTR